MCILICVFIVSQKHEQLRTGKKVSAETDASVVGRKLTGFRIILTSMSCHERENDCFDFELFRVISVSRTNLVHH